MTTLLKVCESMAFKLFAFAFSPVRNKSEQLPDNKEAEVIVMEEKNEMNTITKPEKIKRKTGKRLKPDFEVRHGKRPGEIILIAQAVKNERDKFVKAVYFWEYSIDGGQTWIELPNTMSSKTSVENMQRGIDTLFRKRTYTTKNGMTEWCLPIRIMPH